MRMTLRHHVRRLWCMVRYWRHDWRLRVSWPKNPRDEVEMWRECARCHITGACPMRENHAPLRLQPRR